MNLGAPRRKRIFIVDDHPLVRRALRQLLSYEPNLNVVGEAASGEEVLTRFSDQVGGYQSGAEELGSQELSSQEFSSQTADRLEPSSQERRGHRSNGAPPDLFLVDFSLPGMTGVQLIQTLRKKLPDALCLVVSSRHEAFYVSAALSAGAHGYVTKGDPDVLIAAINGVLEGKVFTALLPQSTV